MKEWGKGYLVYGVGEDEGEEEGNGLCFMCIGAATTNHATIKTELTMKTVPSP